MCVSVCVCVCVCMCACVYVCWCGCGCVFVTMFVWVSVKVSVHCSCICTYNEKVWDSKRESQKSYDSDPNRPTSSTLGDALRPRMPRYHRSLLSCAILANSCDLSSRESQKKLILGPFSPFRSNPMRGSWRTDGHDRIHKTQSVSIKIEDIRKSVQRSDPTNTTYFRRVKGR